MNSILFDIGISAILTALREAIKNATRRAQLKAVMLKIAASIFAVWPEDPEFAPTSASFQAKVKKESASLKANAY